jgi:aspartate kinase
VVVVVSAMAGETNRLLKLTSALAKRPSQREQDVVVSTGEQVTVGLLALAIQELRGKARSFLGHQVRILTDSAFSNARIRSIDGEKLFESLKRGEIAVVAGFQGIDEHGNITTLGRGGSDTTAVALAAALKADACEIYTDVDGVYTTDPNLCAKARKLDRISYEEMLELASVGAKVLQIRSVEFAMKYQVPLWVKSTFKDDPGTLVCEEDQAMEDVVVSGIAITRDEARFVIRDVPDKPGVAAKIFGTLADLGVVVDLIVQTPAHEDGRTDLAFTVGRLDVEKTGQQVRKIAKAIGAGKVQHEEGIAKISIVGVGMRNHAGVAAKMFQVLADERVNIRVISTSEIKVSCLIDEKYAELAVRALHTAFGLDKVEGAA